MANRELSERVSSIKHPYSFGRRVAFHLIGTQGLPLHGPKSDHTPSLQGGLRAFSFGTGLETVNLFSQGRAVAGGIAAALSLGTELLAVRRAHKLEQAILQPPNIVQVLSDLPEDEAPKIIGIQDFTQKVKLFIDPEKVKDHMARTLEDFPADSLFIGSPNLTLSAQVGLGAAESTSRCLDSYDLVLTERYPMTNRPGAIEALDNLKLRGVEDHLNGLKRYVLTSSADSDSLHITRRARITIDSSGLCSVRGRWSIETFQVWDGRSQKMNGLGVNELSHVSEQDLAYLHHAVYLVVYKMREDHVSS